MYVYFEWKYLLEFFSSVLRKEMVENFLRILVKGNWVFKGWFEVF